MEQDKVEQGKIKKRSRGKVRVPFDRLKKQEQRENCSVWKGVKEFMSSRIRGFLKQGSPLVSLLELSLTHVQEIFK